MKSIIDRVVVFIGDLLSHTDEGYRKSCWVGYSALLFGWTMLVLEVLVGCALMALFLALAFSAWRIEKAVGTPYSWHLGNLIACFVATFWFVAVFHVILRRIEEHIQMLASAGAVLVAVVLAGMCAYGIFSLVRERQDYLI